MRVLQILVAGPFGVGKSRFISTISDIPVVATERKMSMPFEGSQKDYTTVAMDYGRVQIGENIFHLRGTPGQERFEFMWDILSKEVDGRLFLVDSTNPTEFDTARHLLNLIKEGDTPPILVVANKQDLNEAKALEEIRTALAIPTHVPVIGCNSLDKQSVRTVLTQIAGLIPT